MCSLHVVCAAAPEVRAILQDEATASADAKTDDFWVLVAALKRFVEEEGHGGLPLEVQPWLPLPPGAWRLHYGCGNRCRLLYAGVQFVPVWQLSCSLQIGQVTPKSVDVKVAVTRRAASQT